MAKSNKQEKQETTEVAEQKESVEQSQATEAESKPEETKEQTKTEIKVEKNIPIPSAKTRETVSKYPFKDMEVGDSFAVPKDEFKKATAAAASYRKKFKNVKFAARTEVSRIWRIE